MRHEISRRTVVTGTVALVASVPALTACTADNKDEGASGAAANDIVIGYGDVDTLDPIQFKSNTGYAVLGNIYGTLVTQEFEEVDGYLRGTDTYAMALAESIDYNTEGTLLTIVLKPGLKFADGSSLTADDVVYTLQRSLSDAGYTGVFAEYLNIANPQTDVVAKDATTVEITTSGVSPVLKKFLAFQTFGIVSKAAAEKASTQEWAPDYFAKGGLSSGPYQVDSWTPGTSIVLKKNPNYTVTDLSRAPGTVTLQNTPSAQQSYLALQNGSIDLALGLPPELTSQAEAVSALHVYKTVSSDLVYLGMNAKDPALQDPRVRQAISYLIDYAGLQEDVMKGYAGDAYGPVPYPMASALDTTGDKLAYPTDAARGKQLLAEAGVSGLSLRLAVQTSDSTFAKLATFIQSSLGEAGIKVAIDQMTDADYTTALGDGTVQLFIGSWYSWGEDGIYQMNFLLKSTAFTNYAHHENPAFDQLLEQGMAQPDDAGRTKFSQQAQQVAIADAPWAFLYTRDALIVAQGGVSGVTRPDDQFPRFQYLTRA